MTPWPREPPMLTTASDTADQHPLGTPHNPGWPLPGHVMTNGASGPGTETWERFQLDGHEW